MTAVDRLNGVNEGIAIKAPCRAATTVNITLAGQQTIDGIAVVAGDRVLVKNQTTGSQNGIYVVSTGNWTRSVDFDGNRDVVNGTRVLVNYGSVSAGYEYYVSTADPITIDSASITFSTVTGLAVAATATAVAAAATATAAAIAAAASAATAATVLWPEGRLTLTTGVPITATDVTGATLVYYAPFVGSSIPIWNGVSFVSTVFAELSNNATASSTGKAGPAAVTTNSIYDLFVWNDSGALRLTRGPAWSSDTSRGTGAGTSEIQFVGGFWTNKVAITNGPAAGYGTLVGSVRSDGSSQLTDSMAKRWLSNVYNVVRRKIKITDATQSWAYTTATLRQARASTANQADVLQSLAGGIAELALVTQAANTDSNVNTVAGIGINSTTTDSSDTHMGGISSVVNYFVFLSARLNHVLPVGRTYFPWLEYSDATGTTTWVGTNAPTETSGIAGTVDN